MERRNRREAGSLRTLVFISQNESRAKEREVEETRQRLRVTAEEKEKVWDSVTGVNDDDFVAQRTLEVRDGRDGTNFDRVTSVAFRRLALIPLLCVDLGEALTGVVKRFQMHTERKHKRQLIAMKAANTIFVTWEEQMARVQERAAIRIQRNFRKKRDARKAKVEASEVVKQLKKEK